MSTLVPRKPYTDDELKQLYPEGLSLQLVQILMRHGERTPVSARFQNAGLRAFWPYCASVRQMKTAIMPHGGERGDAPFSTLEWKRRLETFGENDMPITATGPNGQVDDICDMGALTDPGRQSTFRLGQRLRHLYVDRLNFLPSTISSTEFMYLRTTPIPRALESMQQAFSALYPPTAREPDDTGKYPAPVIVTRAPGDETLWPNDTLCRRFAQLSRVFAQRAADKWNDTEDMAYLTQKLGKWMPDGRVAVDSRPRLSGIMDTMNSTDAHGPQTKLPKEFYDPKVKEILEKITVDEWFSGYKENKEFRTLGIGGLMGDVVGRMMESVEPKPAGDGKDAVKFGLSGCHDTTLGGVLASLGAFETGIWPPFTSHIAIELFRAQGMGTAGKGSWWGGLFSREAAPSIGRKPMNVLSAAEKAKLDGYYVRIRYNDEPIKIPGCQIKGNHLEGDETFCTLTAFKTIVDKYTPQNWKAECRMNLNTPTNPKAEPDPAGY